MLLLSYLKSFSETLLLPHTCNSYWGYGWKHFISVAEIAGVVPEVMTKHNPV